jgi:hypothetical protein
MGINSFITHRMFVAALSHEESAAAEEDSRKHEQETTGELARRILQDPRFSQMTRAEASSRKWSASVALSGM